jgi:hypothetical protein
MLERGLKPLVYVLVFFWAIGFAFLVGEGTQEQNERVRIEAAQKANDGIKKQQGGERARSDISSAIHTDNGSNQSSEITFIGIKLGEALLAFITVLLWLATRDLVATSKDTAQRQLRAYVSGGGWRARDQWESAVENPINPDAFATPLPNGRFLITAPIGFFDIHINNHGQTPARLHHIQWGFFDAAGPVPDDPPYQPLVVQNDAIGSPRNQSKFVRRVEYPAGRWARVAICGRFYWADVLDREWSSGFIYEIAKGNARDNDSISIEAPRVYWEDRREPDAQ